MPKGLKPAGRFGSTKVPEAVMGAKFLSNISTLPLWKSAAYSVFAPALLAIARPVYSVALALLSTAVIACVASSFGDQPAIVPASVAKMNSAGEAVLLGAVTAKSVVPLATMPVGLPG